MNQDSNHDMPNLTKEQSTRLETIATQAASDSSRALSKLIGAPVELEMLRARMTEVDQLAMILASPEAQMSAVLLSVPGHEGGSSALITTLGESRRLAELLTKRSVAADESLDASAISALKECGNIIGGAFLSAFSDAVGMSLVQSVPEFMTGTLHAVVAATVAKLSDEGKGQSVAFEIDFSLRATTTTKTIVAHYLFILHAALAQKILEKKE